MSKAIENLKIAQQQAMAGRPKVGGFPYLAETLRRAGVRRNIWTLPACQSLFLTDLGPVVIAGKPLVIGVGFSGAAIPTILPQPHDIPMDMIVTENGVAHSREEANTR